MINKYGCKMTPSQAKAIEKIRKLGEDLFYGGAEKYEFKNFDVEQHGRTISVFVSTGMKNDEGTYAQIFCRDTAFLFIGVRGGIYYYDFAGKRKVFKGYSLLQAKLDQKQYNS